MDTHASNGSIFCITAMAVDLNRWRRGIGSTILEALLAIARMQQCNKVILETTHAQGLYERYGFQTSRKREQNGVVLTIMELAL